MSTSTQRSPFVTSDGTIVEQTGAIDADELREKVTALRVAESAL